MPSGVGGRLVEPSRRYASWNWPFLALRSPGFTSARHADCSRALCSRIFEASSRSCSGELAP